VNVEDESQSRMQKAWNTREKIWQSSLPSSLKYPNEPPRALLYGENMVNSFPKGIQELIWLGNLT
jgi:hypothetical protein